jgi:hypothetical protein
MESGCVPVPQGASFAAILCQFEALLAQVNASSALGTLQTRLATTLTKGHDRTVQARDVCASASAKHAKKSLKQANRYVIQYAHDLSTLSARKKLGATSPLRMGLLAPVASLKANLHVLQGMLRCPAGAAP